MIIYPPIIGNTIPAFTSIIEVPFTHNPAVGINEIVKMRLTIRTISNNEVIAKDIIANNFNLEAGVAYFDITELIIPKEEEKEKIIPTQWYKFQIAYDDDNQNDVFYYSSVATGRYLGEEPGEIKIINLKPNEINSNLVEYTGYYTSSIYSESVYQYKFSVQEKSREDYIQETGWIITNRESESINEEGKKVFKHNFYLKDELELGKQYTITYTIQTVNGWKNSVSYTIQKAMRVRSVFSGSVIVDQASSESREYGYVNIKLSGKESTNGNFYLYRSQDKRIWDQLGSFTLSANSDISNFSWKDFTIEQGITYTYAIAQYAKVNGTLYISKRILSNPITVDFEHTYLGDGKRQLIVKFNPQVSSFKDTILEQKTDTIGGKYPFFFRNGQVRYKEIPISGLLSYQLDDNHFFMSDEELGLEKNLDSRESTGSKNNVEYKNRTTQLVGYNISAERRFKLAVNDWLTNGQPKLFRSPTEGNYIIRLMNVSLSPNVTVGRMLHTFSATGYQIADAGYEACKANGLDTITPGLKDPEPPRQMATIVVNNGQSDQSFDYEYITNLTYIANTNLLDSKFTIVQNEEILEFYPAQGTITLPTGQYTNLDYNDANLNGTFIIEYIIKNAINNTEDSFEKLISEGTDSFVTLTEATNYNIPMGYYLTAYRNNDEESYIVINNQKIVLLAGAHRYEDLRYNSVLNEIHNAIVVIYGRF